MRVSLVLPNSSLPWAELHLGLGYVAAALRTAGHAVSIADTKAIPIEAVLAAVAQGEVDLLGVTATTPTFPEAKAIAEMAKALSASTPVVIGGAHVSMVRERVLEHDCFDFAVRGEGEHTAVELAAALATGRTAPADLRAIRGLVFRDGSRIVRTAPRPHEPCLDALPFPAVDLFPLERYKFHRLMLTRGCPHRCNYCVIHQTWGRKVRYRSVTNVVAEIRQVLDRHGYKVFAFNDDCFNCRPAYTEELCRALIDERLDIVWKLEGLSMIGLTERTVDLMARAGCSAVQAGIQSMDDALLRRIDRQQTTADVVAGLRLLAARRIPVWGEFMIGNAGDTLTSVTGSIEFAKQAPLRAAKFYPVIPFYRTGLWDYVEQRGRFLPAPDPSGVSHVQAPGGISFVTPEFEYEDRAEAHRRARAAGVFADIDRPRVGAIDNLVYYRLLNDRLFERLSHRQSRWLMRGLSLLREGTHQLAQRRR